MPRKYSMTSLAFGLLLPACEPPPYAVENPTWAQAEPILRGACNHCHGATASVTGASGPVAYRLDFFDLQSCGEAAAAMGTSALAYASAASIRTALTIPPQGSRPRMPPAPAEPLPDWQRETLIRWAENPVKGPPPANNQPPFIRTQNLPAVTDDRLRFTAILEDPDRHPVVGTIRVADVLFKMDRAGAFAVNLDTSTWPEGAYEITASLCDGWVNTSYDLGSLQVRRSGDF